MIRHTVALVVVSILIFGTSYALFYIADRMTPIRVTLEHELLGLDLSQHGETVVDSLAESVEA